MRTTFLAVTVAIALACMSMPASACNKRNLAGCAGPEMSIQGGLNGITTRSTIRGWRGKPVLIKFWAPSCSPCRKQLPEIERLHKRYKTKGLQVVCLSVGPQAKSKAVIKKSKLTMPVGFDNLQKTMARYKVKAIPATFLLDKQGVVRPIGTSLEAAVKRELKRGKRGKR